MKALETLKGDCRSFLGLVRRSPPFFPGAKQCSSDFKTCGEPDAFQGRGPSGEQGAYVYGNELKYLQVPAVPYETGVWPFKEVKLGVKWMCDGASQIAPLTLSSAMCANEGSLTCPSFIKVSHSKPTALEQGYSFAMEVYQRGGMADAALS